MKIYFDENTNIHLVRGIQQLQKGLNQKEAEPVEIFFLPDEFGKGVADEAWIPKLGEDKAVIITHDLNIHRTRQQRELYQQYGLGAFFFSPPSKTGFGYWDLVQQVIKHWPEIKKLSSTRQHRPFAFRFTSRSTKAESI